MLCVLAAVDQLGGNATLLNVADRSGLDKKTVTVLIRQAVEQAGVAIVKEGPVYRIEDWGPVFKKKGALLALTGALNAPTI